MCLQDQGTESPVSQSQTAYFQCPAIPTARPSCLIGRACLGGGDAAVCSRGDSGPLLTDDLLPDRPSDASVTRVISQALPSFLRWQGCKGFERGHRGQSHHLRSPDCLCLVGWRSFLLSQNLLLAYQSLEEFWIPNILLLSSMQEGARMVLGRS